MLAMLPPVSLRGFLSKRVLNEKAIWSRRGKVLRVVFGHDVYTVAPADRADGTAGFSCTSSACWVPYHVIVCISYGEQFHADLPAVSSPDEGRRRTGPVGIQKLMSVANANA